MSAVEQSTAVETQSADRRSATRVRVLHVIPDSARDPRYFYLGSTKDIRCRTEYFADRGIPCDEIVAVRRSDANVIEQLEGRDLSRYTDVVFELAFFPRAMAVLERQAPHVTRILRPGNAQLLHQLDAMRVRKDYLHPYPWKIVLERTLNDVRSARHSDLILSITEWETLRYWRWLAPKDRLRDVTYFVADQYDRSGPADEKKLVCVCLTTAIAGTPFIIDATRTFANAVQGLGDDLPAWSFLVTGDLTGYRVDLPARARGTGYLDDIAPVMRQARAIALLSDFGYGFKTKVLDAIRYGAYVLVTQGLFDRMTAELQPYLIVVDPTSPASFRRALSLAERPFPAGDPNATLKAQAYAALDEIFAKERVRA